MNDSNLITYAKKCFEPAITNYLRIWELIFSSWRVTTDFRNIFVPIELCFCIPVGNVEPEPLFSRFKRIKIDNKCSGGSTTLENFVRTGYESPSGKDCDALAVIELWTSDKFQRPTGQKRKHSIKKGTNWWWNYRSWHWIALSLKADIPHVYFARFLKLILLRRNYKNRYWNWYVLLILSLSEYGFLW